MAYSTGPYNKFTSLPPPDTTVLGTSRKIDFATKRYVTDDDGNFEAMKDIAQRVALKVAFAVPEPKFITPQEIALTDALIRAALQDMTSGPEPEIAIVSLAASSTSPGSLKRILEFRDLTNGTIEKVQI